MNASWRDHAACTTYPTAAFFPDIDWYPGYRARGVPEKVKQICAGCPVREECLSWALDLPEEHGYWGGTTPGEREKLHRGISRKGCPVCHSRDLASRDGRQVCLGCGMSWKLKPRKQTRPHQATATAEAA